MSIIQSRPLGDTSFADRTTPSGLFSFASTTFILSMFNVHARGVVVPNAVIGMACFVGGLAQVLAGMWGMSPPSISLKRAIG